MQQSKDYGEFPTTTRTTEINGKKYVVVNVYAGKKDFKKAFCDLAFRQVTADMKELNN